MSARTSYARRVTALLFFVALMVSPRAVWAQETPLADPLPSLSLGALQPSLVTAFAQVAAVEPLALSRPAPADEGRSLFLGLYAAHAVVQALDVHSTTRALGRGAVEGNPLLTGVAGNPLALSLVKAGGGAATIYFAEKLRKRSRLGAVLLMVGVNSFYATVVAHNYGVASGR